MSETAKNRLLIVTSMVAAVLWIDVFTRVEAYPAKCEVTIKNMVTGELTKSKAGRQVPGKTDKFDIFESCQEYGNILIMKSPNSKVIQVKAYFL